MDGTHGSADDVSRMDYSRFVGLTRERNRPSGGVRTVQEVAIQARIDDQSRVLEIGSNTGFTAVNLALLTGASVVGIDVNSASVDEARRYAATMGGSGRVSFLIGDGRDLELADESFDVIWVSNVVSFVGEKAKMRNETIRLLKPHGVLVSVPIYYRHEPPHSLVSEVSAAIGTPVEVMAKSDWLGFFAATDRLQLFYDSDYEYEQRTTEDIDAYCDVIMSKPHLRALPEATRAQVQDRLAYFMSLFNNNLTYAGFSVMLYQKRAEHDEVELFVSRPVSPVSGALG